MKKIILAVAFLMSVPAFAQDKITPPVPQAGNVTLPLEEYNRLLELANKSPRRVETAPLALHDQARRPETARRERNGPWNRSVARRNLQQGRNESRAHFRNDDSRCPAGRQRSAARTRRRHTNGDSRRSSRVFRGARCRFATKHRNRPRIIQFARAVGGQRAVNARSSRRSHKREAQSWTNHQPRVREREYHD